MRGQPPGELSRGWRPKGGRGGCGAYRSGEGDPKLGAGQIAGLQSHRPLRDPRAWNSEREGGGVGGACKPVPHDIDAAGGKRVDDVPGGDHSRRRSWQDLGSIRS